MEQLVFKKMRLPDCRSRGRGAPQEAMLREITAQSGPHRTSVARCPLDGMGEDAECILISGIHLLCKYLMAPSPVRIRLDCHTADLDNASLSQTLRTIRRFPSKTHIRFGFLRCPLLHSIEQQAGVIYFREQAGSAIAEPACSPIVCPQ